MHSHVRGISLLLPLAVLVFSPGVLGREERPAPPPHEIPEYLAHRTKRTHLGAEGGNAKTESAVRAGLDWLARHQSEKGYWDAAGFKGRCEGDECDGEGYALYDPGVTGLALLAFLADGQTYKSGDHRSAVMNAVKYLKIIQGPEGCFGPRSAREFVYNHAIATLAWVEVYALTGSKLFAESGQRAVDFIQKAQNPGMGWRYGVRPEDNDSSVTAWMLVALHAAREAGLKVDPASFAGAEKFLGTVVDPETGEFGYTAKGTGAARAAHLMDKYPAKNSASLTALGMLSRLLLAKSVKQEKATSRMRLGKTLCLSLPPRWETPYLDMYYWYYGSMALFQLGGKDWKEWNTALKKALLPHQRKKGCAKGSWDPAGPWGANGGRVYSTAMCTLMLQSYYRYGRIQ